MNYENARTLLARYWTRLRPHPGKMLQTAAHESGSKIQGPEWLWSWLLVSDWGAILVEKVRTAQSPLARVSHFLLRKGNRSEMFNCISAVPTVWVLEKFVALLLMWRQADS